MREVERRVAAPAKRSKSPKARDPVVQTLEQALQDHFGTRVEIRSSRAGKGSIEIRYHGAEDFERVFELLTGRPASEIVE